MIGLFTNLWHTASDERLQDAIAKISHLTGLTESEQPHVLAEWQEMATLFR